MFDFLIKLFNDAMDTMFNFIFFLISVFLFIGVIVLINYWIG